NSGFARSLPGTHLWFHKDDQGLSQRTRHAEDVLARILEPKAWILRPVSSPDGSDTTRCINFELTLTDIFQCKIALPKKFNMGGSWPNMGLARFGIGRARPANCAGHGA